ncbi:hypothetical protein GCM10010123_37010 [Pilimelia anulata]|uniref:NADH:quinone oxidoreductase/Mrp antiporter transmembrane domain-containing protein n=1 Tax=Pilimelia anulata TaxID=53371 RepID=A0A8J3BCD8_9ACTN|nr:proton-conducting transporter membrane subunit [Pilimelia anulata]GGK03650.1 hypothetical protein GCM10010123_37010 [Pilimelia anulata]
MSAGLVALAVLPFAAFAGLALPAWLGVGWSERVVSGVVTGAFAASTGVALAVAPFGRVTAALAWYPSGARLRLLLDGLALPFAVLVPLLLTLVVVLSRRYLHAEPGYLRFHLLLALFGGGAQLVVVAGSLDTLVVGWELAGLASCLLIAFFHERRQPVAHALRAFAVYRACDVGLVGVLLWAHHGPGTAFTAAGGLAPPGGASALVGLGLLWAAVGKGALVPLGGWLPRAMEGPTPSSALCYGAVSITLGPYLLLRATAGWPPAAVVSAATVLLGLATAAHATLVGRVQTDAKTGLAYAAMAQVGLVVAEIGAGLTALAVWHLLAHAALRSAQLLRAPSLLHDHQHREAAHGAALPPTGAYLDRLVPAGVRRWAYRHALERGHLDALLRDLWDPVAGALRRRDAAGDRRHRARRRPAAGAAGAPRAVAE